VVVVVMVVVVMVVLVLLLRRRLLLLLLLLAARARARWRHGRRRSPAAAAKQLARAPARAHHGGLRVRERRELQRADVVTLAALRGGGRRGGGRQLRVTVTSEREEEGCTFLSFVPEDRLQAQCAQPASTRSQDQGVDPSGQGMGASVRGS